MGVARTLSLAVPLLAVTCSVGCYSKDLYGARIMPPGYSPEVVVDYVAEGAVPQGVSYQLVRRGDAEAIFERFPDGSGTLITNQWESSEGTHYFCWVTNSHGFEFVVPVDRGRSAEKRIYAGGYYEVPEGQRRPNARTPPIPVAALRPAGGAPPPPERDDSPR